MDFWIFLWCSRKFRFKIWPSHSHGCRLWGYWWYYWLLRLLYLLGLLIAWSSRLWCCSSLHYCPFLLCLLIGLCEVRRPYWWAQLNVQEFIFVRFTWVKLTINPLIWNCQTSEWTVCFSMWSMRTHSKQSTNRKI